MKLHKHRILWLDFVKGICVCMVVLCHSVNFAGLYNHISYNTSEVILKEVLDILMMPSFFAVSGYLYRRVNCIKGFLILLYKKISSFVIPYVIFYFFFTVTLSKSIKQFCLSMKLKNIFLHPAGDLWFLQILFLIFVFVGIMDLLQLNKKIQFISMLILIFIFLFLIAPKLHHVHAILQFFNILFFLLGELLRDYIKIIREYTKYIVILFIISFVIMIDLPVSYDDQFITKSTLLPKFIGVFLIFGVALNISRKNKIFKYFTKYGRYTLIIYVVHFVPLVLIESFLSKFIKIIMFQQIITFVITWYLSILICYLVENIIGLNFIFYPKKYINKMIKDF